jgi:hypothetical protein
MLSQSGKLTDVTLGQYLCESRFEHAAYNLRHEARLDQSPLLATLTPVVPNGTAFTGKGKQPTEGRNANGPARRRDSAALLDGQGDGHIREAQSDLAGLVPRGKLVTMLQSGLMFNEVKRHTGPGGVSGRPPRGEHAAQSNDGR